MEVLLDITLFSWIFDGNSEILLLQFYMSVYAWLEFDEWGHETEVKLLDMSQHMPCN